MLWKILSLLSALCLGGSCYFAWTNQQDLQAERKRDEFNKANMNLAKERKKEADTLISTKKETLELTKKDLEAAKQEATQLAENVKEKEAALSVVKGNLEQVQQQVSTVEKQIDEAGDIEKLLAQINKVKNSRQEAESALANQSQRLSTIKEQNQSLAASTDKLREQEALGRRGQVSPEFTARISEFYQDWDFAVLSKGNSTGIFANADLDVKRGSKTIAKLKVKNVEQYGSIAEIIPGSIAEGQVIRRGDLVVASATAPVIPAAKPEAKKDSAAPAASPATESAPQPAPAAEPASMPAAESDPFAESAPAAAPAASAPPAATADPFGTPTGN